MLDSYDRRILEDLLSDGRMSLKGLAASVGLSSPSVAERVRRLEEKGVIRGFTVEIDPRALGYALQAIVRIRPLPGQMHAVQRILQETPSFCECDKVTGEDCFVARMFVRSIEDLDSVVDALGDRAETNTSIVKSQPIRRRAPPLVSGRREGGER